jgi:hypothetical protein
VAGVLLPLDKTAVMSDNKMDRGSRDRIRVDRNDPGEVEYLHKKFRNKTHEEIKEAIRAYGPMRENIERHLRGEGERQP